MELVLLRLSLLWRHCEDGASQDTARSRGAGHHLRKPGPLRPLAGTSRLQISDTQIIHPPVWPGLDQPQLTPAESREQGLRNSLKGPVGGLGGSQEEKSGLAE